jgi:hypothetical protein
MAIKDRILGGNNTQPRELYYDVMSGKYDD